MQANTQITGTRAQWCTISSSNSPAATAIALRLRRISSGDVSFFTVSTAVGSGGSPLLAVHSNRRTLRSRSIPLAERRVAVVSIIPTKSVGAPTNVCPASAAATVHSERPERLPSDRSAPSGRPSIVTVAPWDACSTMTPRGSGLSASLLSVDKEAWAKGFDAARAGRLQATIRGQIRFLAVRHLVPSKRTRNRYKQEVPMALEKTA